jgi:hypothetical protein
VPVKKGSRKIRQVRPLRLDFPELFKEAAPDTAVAVHQILCKATVIASEVLATQEFCGMRHIQINERDVGPASRRDINHRVRKVGVSVSKPGLVPLPKCGAEGPTTLDQE